jgi:CCR4-NOT transcriptional regulation complex NOT5 subunit
MEQNMNRVITIGSMLILGIATSACNTPNPPATVQRDVSKAEADRTANVANARQDGAQAVQRQQKDVDAERRDVSDAQATENYNVALAKADGDYKVAVASCDALAGTAQVNCKDQAEAVLKSDKASAELLKPKS